MTTLTNPTIYNITWEKLPDDFILPDDPVDNINQPLLATALSDSLESTGYLSQNALTTTNYGICVLVNGRVVVKAPDWCYIPRITASRADVYRSYTPHLQGEIPSIVMEFVSDTDGGEYSQKDTYPFGKWTFYEEILKVPNYVIFKPKTDTLEVYHLDASNEYKQQFPNAQGLHWIPEMRLYLGIWQGTRENRTGSWLRWWNLQGELLLWGLELANLEKQRAEQEKQRAEQEKQRAEQEKQRAEQEKQRAEQEKQRADRLAAQLRSLGLDPDQLTIDN